MHCPLCDLAMATVDYEGVPVHACDACGGEFIAAEPLRHIVNTRGRSFCPETRAALADHQPAHGVPVEARHRRLTCPSCRHGMDVINYAGDTGVCVDRCGECHGLWLDRHELEKVQILMERWADDAPEKLRAVAGSLEQARRENAEGHSRAFAGSRFAFVNAVINRLLDAA